jgi:hypothetical protein
MGGMQMQGQAMNQMATLGLAQQTRQQQERALEQRERQANQPKREEVKIGDQVVTVLRYPDGRMEPIAEAPRWNPERPPPPMQSRREGMEVVYERWNPEAKRYEEVSRGPVTGRTEFDVNGVPVGTAEGSIVPPGTDVSQSIGLGGLWRGMVNSVRDAVGAGLQYPDAEDARFAITNIRLQAVSAMQAPIPGRPNQFIQQMIDQNNVRPNEILMGTERAKRSYTQWKHTIDTEIDRMEREVLQMPMTQSKRQEVLENHSQLKQLSRSYSEILDSWGSKSGNAPVSSDVEDILKRRGL